MRFQVRCFAAILLCTTLLCTTLLRSQTRTTGDLSGSVTDPAGAVVPDAAITLTHQGTGAVQTATTDSAGFYRFALLPPGEYSATASKAGFQTVKKTVQVSVGSSLVTNFQLPISSSRELVEVVGISTGIETEDASLNTNFSAKQVELQPNPGNDLTAVALTTPGAVMNTAGDSLRGGNFEVYGLPATSNLFTVDGASMNDPYFNINNSGAANMALGLNDIQESTVVANAYSGSYGGVAGANVSYVSKSGTNSFHGNAIYWWNGDALNANEYFRNSQGLPRLFANANQFAASVGGPIKKNKAFFFFDLEGIYLAVPSPSPVNLPTVPFENAVIANLNNNGLSDSVPFYQQAFTLYNGVSQKGAQQIFNGGCSDVTTLNGTSFGSSNPCAVLVQAGPLGHTHDLVYIGRYDQNFGSKDSMFVRVVHEHGRQDTYVDPISPNFDVTSDQPQWQSQLQAIHVFNPAKVNVFNASLLWYSAFFNMKDPVAAIQSFPGAFIFGDGSLAMLNPGNWEVPQGRATTQYQFTDDFSWTHGRHNLRLGANFRRADVSDRTFLYVTPLILDASLGDFVEGGGVTTGDEIVQNFPSRTEVPVALYQLGFYGADDLRVTNKFTLTLSLRFDHFSNPVCQIGCFQHLSAPFYQLNTSAPVNQAIVSSHSAFPSVSGLVPQPKIGFAWTPFDRRRKTAIRGGAGIFADSLPTGAIDSFMQNPPLDPGFVNAFGPISPAQPTSPFTGLPNLWAASLGAYAQYQAGYAGGGAVPPLNFYNATSVKAPRYYEWSLEVQQELGWNSALSVKYVGNHGSHEEISNSALNAFNASLFPAQFGDLPFSPQDSRFGVVSEQQNVANSNYHGLVIDAKHDFSGGLHFEAGYIWSHALDEISNNSLSPFGQNTIGVYADVIYPQDPYNIHKYNYGNADYDIQHSFTMNYVWSNGFRHLTSRGPNVLMKGWSFSGTILRHSGLPFTVISENSTSALEATVNPLTGQTTAAYYGLPGFGTQYVFADVTGPTSHSCSGRAANPLTPCLSASNFADPTTNWGQQRRNQFRGPGYFDSDFAVEKAFGLFNREDKQFSIGARFFNLFNHPDFYYPVMNLDNTGLFGRIIQTASSPTSIYGTGLGANSSPRLIQLQAKIVF